MHHILFRLGWGSAPDPAGGVYSAHQIKKTGFKGPTSKGKEGRERERRGRKGKEGKEMYNSITYF